MLLDSRRSGRCSVVALLLSRYSCWTGPNYVSLLPAFLITVRPQRFSGSLPHLCTFTLPVVVHFWPPIAPLDRGYTACSYPLGGGAFVHSWPSPVFRCSILNRSNPHPLVSPVACWAFPLPMSVQFPLPPHHMLSWRPLPPHCCRTLLLH